MNKGSATSSEGALHRHHNVLKFSDRRAGLEAIVALHQPLGGVAMGGTRVLPYFNCDDALADALLLSEAMTYKAAAAGLPIGGAKGVIICDPRQKTPALLQSYAQFVNSLGGRFVTGQDLNVSTEDVLAMARETPHMVGISPSRAGPAEMTARGVFAGLQAAAASVFGTSSFRGVRVAVQGVGAVGARLAQLLADAGARLVVADVDQSRAAKVAANLGARLVDPETIYDQEVDILAPCAQGGGLNERTIPRLEAKLVGGAANNQLKLPGRDGAALTAMGITYCPDFIINSGGLIEVYCEYRQKPDEADQLVARIGATVKEVLTEAVNFNLTTHAAAVALAMRRRAEFDLAVLSPPHRENMHSI